MIEYQIIIGGVDYTEYCTLPFKEQYVLDSALDNAVLTLTMTPQNKVFKPFTLVTITRQGDTYNMYVASDNMTEIIGTGLYNHELTLIEETKLLEKKVVDTNTTTQPLLRDNSLITSSVFVNYEQYYTIAIIGRRDLIDSSGFLSNLYPGTININQTPSINCISASSFISQVSTVTNGTMTLTITEHGETTTYTANETQTLNLSVGTYEFTYRSLYTLPLGETYDWYWKFTIEVVDKDITGSKEKTITDVVNRLLTITDTIRASETPALKFNDEQAEFYNQVEDIWEIKSTIGIRPLVDLFEANFISKNQKWYGIYVDQAERKIAYVDAQEEYFYVYNGTWIDEDYRTIIFNQKVPNNLLYWLQIEAVEQSFKYLYPAPEFSMTKSTLRECLDQVGGYIHSIVRLKGNEIYFDKLGGNTQSTFDTDYIGHYETLDCEQYTSQLDSVVSNLTNIDDETTGTITEPFADIYKTVRAESGTLRIGDGQNDTTAIIETDYPIEKIIKLICGYKNQDDEYVSADITPYVYESAEYGLLSSNTGNYPDSKGYAIKYTQGESNITGLTFKLPNAVSSVLENEAILNIMEHETGITFQTALKVKNITELNFQLIYCPSTTARVKQSRTDITNYSMELTSIYNQGANKVDSRAYGENLKGAVARLGNIDKVITYYFSSLNEVAPVGSYITIDNEDYYVATVGIENQMDYLKATLGLSKDFNALSKYIGIKNNIRMYEVSEKQTVERYVTYEDYCIIGNKVEHDELELITSIGKSRLTRQFNAGQNATPTSAPLSVIKLVGIDKNEINLTTINLPIFSLALGNSVWLGCKYADNYSAGNQSVIPEFQSQDTSKSDKYYRLNYPLRYTDQFGEIEKLSVSMFTSLGSPLDETMAITVGNTVPGDVSQILQQSTNALLSTQGLVNDNPLVIKKDNREQINFSYQLHFVTNNGIIIGTQLVQGNILCSTVGNNYAKLYILPNRINKFADKIDLTGATLVHSYQGDSTNITYDNLDEVIEFANVTANANGKSWVLVDAQNERLLFGKNIAIANGNTIEMPTMSFTHKII